MIVRFYISLIFVAIEEETEDSKPRKGLLMSVENMCSPAISAKMFGVDLGWAIVLC